ncbi:hypothetical protein BOX15_Mlig011448g3 [Macrostomum lignano]|uniref:NADH dehydrogenase [ubiquinone] 1 beta subcomplex subunit 7 n=1 Tax=Macrostomum lignano TaxID=282301 RepID=A0A267FW43_9PLAT|nr:hypothetical protein BOX15_Mlig028097g3 [Macrostomum lignano]PAA77953.1 hypothetical protein BOX15_Mlig024763g1 [Macrostomum lignano]PAA81446.1 hypothetical protein BOX15_Mlig011448g3 [Macrostomum lignano]
MGQALVPDRLKHMHDMYLNPDAAPDLIKGSRFDPLLGFPNGRKERPMPPITEDEMIMAGLPEQQRDYCAHWYLAFFKCRYQYKARSFWKCADVLHGVEQCQYDDRVLRMKEHERERRLMLRQAKGQLELE